MFALGLIFLVTVFRILPHPANFTPMGAVAVLSGRSLPRGKAILVTIAAMVVSDFALSRIYGWTFLGATSFFVYSGFVLQALIARMTRYRTGGALFSAFSGALIFFAVSNLGVWINDGMYPRNLVGLAECYTAALPFLRMTLLGDLAWTAIGTLAFRLYQSRAANPGKILPAF